MIYGNKENSNRKKIEIMSKEDESVGRYSSLKKASQMAKLETVVTKRKHRPVKTSYFCMSKFIDLVCWTVVLEK